jgi:hypothetical protein
MFLMVRLISKLILMAETQSPPPGRAEALYKGFPL